jgi:hypothetical protein
MIGWKEVAGQLANIGLPTLGGLVGTMVAGGAGGAVGNSLGRLTASAVAAALGVPPEPEAVARAIEADPNGSALKLAQVEAESKAHAADLADTQDARATMVALAGQGSPLSYGAVVVSCMIVLGFLSITILILTFPGLRADPLAQAVFYSLLPIFVQVPAYWIGSSDGNKRGNEFARDMARVAPLPVGSAVPSGVRQAAAAALAKAGKL